MRYLTFVHVRCKPLSWRKHWISDFDGSDLFIISFANLLHTASISSSIHLFLLVIMRHFFGHTLVCSAPVSSSFLPLTSISCTPFWLRFLFILTLPSFPVLTTALPLSSSSTHVCVVTVTTGSSPFGKQSSETMVSLVWSGCTLCGAGMSTSHLLTPVTVLFPVLYVRLRLADAALLTFTWCGNSHRSTLSRQYLISTLSVHVNKLPSVL